MGVGGGLTAEAGGEEDGICVEGAGRFVGGEVTEVDPDGGVGECSIGGVGGGASTASRASGAAKRLGRRIG